MKKLSLLILFMSMTSGFVAQASDNWFDYKRGLFLADRENKYLLLNFCDKTDSYCDKLDKETFQNPEIQKILKESFIKVRLNPFSNDVMVIKNQPVTEKDIVNNYKVSSIPSISFLNSKGNIVSGSIKGFIPADKLSPILSYINSEAYKTKTFKAFMAEHKESSTHEKEMVSDKE